MSNVSKGKQYEKEVQKILESKGYIVERAFNKTVWLARGRVISVAHDFFGQWDIIAKKFDEPTLWVQVTVWEMVSAKKKKLSECGYEWNSDFDCPVIYARIRGRNGHFRVLYGKDGYEWQGETELVKK